MGKGTKIDVNPEIRDRLRGKGAFKGKGVKDDMKGHKRFSPSKRVTYDDILTLLISDYYENKARGRKIKKLEQQLRDIRQGITPAPETTTDAPTQSPPTPKTPILAVHPSHECAFYSEGDDGLVHCSKDYDRKGIVHRVTQDVCNQHWKRMKNRLEDNERLAEHFPCLRRFKGHDGRFHCVTAKGKATPLEYGLKTCQACADRLTEEIVATKGITLVTRRYVTCGATEQIDKERGVMLYCKNKACPHRNTWISIEACQEAKCPLLKTMKVPLTD